MVGLPPDTCPSVSQRCLVSLSHGSSFPVRLMTSTAINPQRCGFAHTRLRQPGSPAPAGGTGLSGGAGCPKSSPGVTGQPSCTAATSAGAQRQPAGLRHKVLPEPSQFSGEAGGAAQASPHSARGGSSWRPWSWPRVS